MMSEPHKKILSGDSLADRASRISDIRPHARQLLALSSGQWTLDNFLQKCNHYMWKYRPPRRLMGLDLTGHIFVLDPGLILEVVFEPRPAKFPTHDLFGYYGYVEIYYHVVEDFDEVDGE